MKYVICVLALIWALPTNAMGPWQDCEGPVACTLGDRSYHVKLPDGWDGQSPLPVMLHFHGWSRTGALPVNHGRISGATRRRGVLLLAPNGLNKSWNFWDRDTDDVAFAAAVLGDAARRYPIDPDNIFVSGYSFGAAMAWRYACQNGNDVRALLAVSGTLRQSEQCPQMPREVRHVHGVKDTVMTFPMGPGSDVTYPVALWRTAMGCGAVQAYGTWQQVDFLAFERTVWNDCVAGRVSLDLHPGGHFIPHGWFARQLDELLDLPFSYP
jgi:polyhydroxybutyrate depolymerase